MKLGMETRFGIEEIPSETEADEILKRFGTESIMYWHDVGHAAVKEMLEMMNLEGILEHFSGRTAGMHLQDFEPPGGGSFAARDWGRFDFSRLAPFVTGEMVLAWEIHPQWKPEEITQGLKQVHDLLRKAVTV